MVKKRLSKEYILILFIEAFTFYTAFIVSTHPVFFKLPLCLLGFLFFVWIAPYENKHIKKRKSKIC